MELQPSKPKSDDKDLNSISDDDIRAVGSALGKVSWTLFRKDFSASPYESQVLNIGYETGYLIESYNWFGTEGLSAIFLNKELFIQDVGVIRFLRPELGRPRKDKVNQSGEAMPLWPLDAITGKIDYSGPLTVEAEIVWDPSRAKAGINNTGIDPIPRFELGKVPVMVGSRFCNLSTLRSQEELVEVGGCATEHVAYFVTNGLQKTLIAQNYLKPDRDLSILAKLGTQQYTKTVCNVRSKGLDGAMTMHKVFIMTTATNKVKHSDRRIYMKMDWTKKNAYDPSQTTIGINVYSVFRLAVIALHVYNPFGYSGSYRYADDPGDDARAPVTGGYAGESTYAEAGRHFLLGIREFCGPQFSDIIQNYLNDTANEAILEDSEQVFWQNTIKVQNVDVKGKSIMDLAPPLLDLFCAQFMPHLSKMTFAMRKRSLEKARIDLSTSIEAMHKAVGIDPNDKYETETTRFILSTVLDLNAAINSTSDEAEKAQLLAQRAQQLERLTQRGIQATPTVIDIAALYADFKADMMDKMTFLAYMCTKVLRIEMGVDTYDDRDSPANQMYEHAGILMASRLASMLREIEKGLNTFKTADVQSIVNVLTKMGKNIITNGFSSNFAKSEWNSKNATKKRTGVTDLMPASVTNARLSFLRRVSAQSTGHSKNTASREISGLQIGGICPSETPEGQQCGNVEHLASAAFITNESSDASTLAYKLLKLKTTRQGGEAQDLVKLLSKTELLNLVNGLVVDKPSGSLVSLSTNPLSISRQRSGAKNTPLFLNGRPMGWVEGLRFRKFLIELRRQGRIHPHTGIHYIDKMSRVGPLNKLSVETSGGRIVQPLIIAEDPQETVNMLWRLAMDVKAGRDVTVAQMIANGYIEFIDPAELEFLDLAPSVETYLRSIQDGLPERFSHIMLNPAFIQGFAGNAMPFGDMNPVVRLSYFTQMAKQPVDVPNPTYLEVPHTAVSKLNVGQRPLVKTDIYDSILKDEIFGMNVRIMIWPHRQGEEDGIVINRRFLDAGGLSSVKYTSFPVAVGPGQELEFGKDFMETVSDPDRYGRGIIRETKKVARLNPDGTTTIVDEPVIVGPNEILARKTWKSDDEKAFEPITHDSLRDGIVDRIMWSKSSGASKIAYVVIKTPDDIWVGDKLASRYSQKGVVTAVIEEKDMPVNMEDGSTPDLIINPQAFPSRMTIGMLAEMLTANALVAPDKTKNVFMLYNNRGLDLFAPLERLFIVDEKKWNAYNFSDGDVHADEHVSEDGSPDLTAEQTAPLSPTGARIQPFAIPDVKAEKKKMFNPAATYTVVSSEDVYNQDAIAWLKANDKATDIEVFKTGLWVLRFYGDENSKIYGLSPTRNFIIVDTVALNPDLANYTDDNRRQDAEPRQALFTAANLFRSIAYEIKVAPAHVEIIEGLWFDGEKDIDGRPVNPMRGIRISNLPHQEIEIRGNRFAGLGKTIQEVYIRGNSFTPVATQYIASYKTVFFERGNLYDNFLYDYYIPENMRLVENITPPGEDHAVNFTLPPKTTYGLLRKEKVPIKQFVYVPVKNESGEFVRGDNGQPLQRLEEIETTILEAWHRAYPAISLIPVENVIDLPAKASDIYVRRRKKIEELQTATLFKEGLDIKDAQKELQLMGYSPDMKARFMNPKTGKELKGGVVTAWTYYMKLKHMVKYKMQARGFGRKDARTHQPVQGRNKGGGLRFNFADALAVVKTGASAFIADRLLDSSAKKDVFVCKNCREICYREGESGAMLGSIVCPICRTEADAIRISVPYSFLLERNLAMGAGVRLQIEPARDDFDEVE